MAASEAAWSREDHAGVWQLGLCELPGGSFEEGAQPEGGQASGRYPAGQ